jgi:6-pyruvoyl-tetrahydropterin synthase
VSAELDHRFLLQARSTLLASELRDGAWRLRCGDRGYVFPAADVVALPIANSTAELLAEWCWERLAAALAAEGQRGLARLAVEVEEMPGQAGGYARDLPA